MGPARSPAKCPKTPPNVIQGGMATRRTPVRGRIPTMLVCSRTQRILAFHESIQQIHQRGREPKSGETLRPITVYKCSIFVYVIFQQSGHLARCCNIALRTSTNFICLVLLGHFQRSA